MDPIEQNILGVQQLVGSKTNKISYSATNQLEGVEGEFEDEFTLKLSDEELLKLANQWESKYRGYESKVKLRQDANKTFYLGRQKEAGSMVTTEGQSISNNLLFEAVETFLPAALSKNPEPVVWADNTPEGNRISNDVKTMLQYHADVLVLRQKLSQTTRDWLIYLIGVLKHGFDSDIQEITTDVRRPQNFVFDPDGYVDCYGDYVGPLGERITVTASRLIELFPKHKEFITIMCDGKLGTDVTYTEWWTDEYCFYTFKGRVLEKDKNPHFNPDKQIQATAPDGTPEIDEKGQPVMTTEQGKNHFAKAKKPYTFLSVFSLGEQPHDITGLIEQNIPNQRRISRRTEQIDYNLSRQNNSDIFSEDNFNQETGKQAAKAMAQGHPVLVPAGRPLREAIDRLPAQGLDSSFFDELESSKDDLRSIFGTQGITPDAGDKDETARGMILNTQHDNTRIGGGIGDKLEQVADNIFNWWVQLYYVYYDTPHYAAIMGQMKAVEYVTLSQQNFNKKLVVSVAPDSMKPKDETSQMSQAMSLFEAGALDPKTLLTMLDFPDPGKTAEATVLWNIDKNAYLQINFPEVAQQLQAIQAQQMAQQLQQGEQQMAQSDQQAGQQLSQKDEAHKQKMAHNEESFKQKQTSLAANKASASLKNVPIKTNAAPK